MDSHTAGEPTRVVIDGGPELGSGSICSKLELFVAHYNRFRSAVVNEPRGSSALVGALLTPPLSPGSAAGVIFFNNVGFLGMCGHGAIGVVTTLAYLGRIQPGDLRLETPVGTVAATLHDSGEVSVRNVPSYRFRQAVTVDVDGVGIVTGDVAWGGNWFYLVEAHGRDLALENVEELTFFTWRVRQELERAGVTGPKGETIDHVELFAPSLRPGVQSKNFVLCPGRAYDRSPCGTGTSAKLACLFSDGLIREGEVWRQEGICGTVFEGSVEVVDGAIVPTIRGRAFICAESELILNADDPYRWGIV